MKTLNMSFDEARKVKSYLEENCKAASDALQVYPVGAMGLTPDDVKASPEFKRDKQAWNVAFSALRSFNAIYVKQFKNELKEQRRNRFK